MRKVLIQIMVFAIGASATGASVRADFSECTPYALAGRPPFELKPVIEKYRLEIDVLHFGAATLESFKLSVKDGKIRTPKGPLEAPDAFIYVMQGRDLYARNPDLNAREYDLSPADYDRYTRDERGLTYGAAGIPLAVRHTSFFAAAPVAGAGTLSANNGTLIEITTASGHYAPNPEFLNQVLTVLYERGVDLRYARTAFGNAKIRNAVPGPPALQFLFSSAESLACIQGILNDPSRIMAKDLNDLRRIDERALREFLKETERAGTLDRYGHALPDFIGANRNFAKRALGRAIFAAYAPPPEPFLVRCRALLKQAQAWFRWEE